MMSQQLALVDDSEGVKKAADQPEKKKQKPSRRLSPGVQAAVDRVRAARKRLETAEEKTRQALEEETKEREALARAQACASALGSRGNVIKREIEAARKEAEQRVEAEEKRHVAEQRAVVQQLARALCAVMAQKAARVAEEAEREALVEEILAEYDKDRLTDAEAHELRNLAGINQD